LPNPFQEIVKWRLAWQESIDSVTPYVVKILTPYGSGTGFMISHGKNKNICGIATAAHVVEQAHYWEQVNKSGFEEDNVFGRSRLRRR